MLQDYYTTTIGENGKAKFKEIKGIKRVEKKELCYTITKLENGDNFIADGAVVGVEERRYNNKINNTKFKYSDNEILDFAISKGELAKNTVKLKDEPVVGEDMLEKPIFFVYIEGRPNDKKEELYDGELSTKEYYRIYFGQNYGDHVARYQTLFLKYNLSEAYSSDDIIFDKKDKIIYKKSR